MKEKLVRVLTALGMRRMAVAVVGVTSEEPEAFASAMAEQVEAEVQAKLDAHPLLMACTAAGIVDVSDLRAALDMRDFGAKCLVELRADAKAEAIRAFGQETGPTIAAAVESLGASQVKTLRDAWRAQADATFGIAGNGVPARASAPAGREAVPVEERDEPKTKWEQLSTEQKNIAVQLGATTPEMQEKFAAEYLSRTEGK